MCIFRRILALVSVRENEGGYLCIRAGRQRDKYLHRAVWETVAGAPVPEDFHVHHQDFDKKNCCPHNLICMPAAFNPTGNAALERSWRGRFQSKEEVPF